MYTIGIALFQMIHFFGYGSVAAFRRAIVVTMIALAPDVLVIVLAEMVMAKDAVYSWHLLFLLIAILINACASVKICCKLQESKNNGNKILGSFATLVVQASICAGLIFFIIKASEVIVDEKTAALCRIFAGLNAVISAIACLACLCFFFIALYERHQNGKIAEEYAELAMEKLGFIDGKSSNNSPPPGTEEENSDQKPSAPPIPTNENPSLNSIDVRGNDDVMYSPRV